MAKMFNRARMTVTSTGTGALSLGVAVAGYQTFSSAGAQNGDSVSYAVEDGLKWEIGTGTYNSVAGTLSRTVTQSFDGTTYGTAAISVTTSAQVFISPLAADLQYGTSAGNLVQLDGSARLPAVDGSLVTALNASNISSGTIAAARVPTLNQNTTGTAANVTGTVAVANGGTGLTSLTAGYIPYATATNTLGTSANFTYNGTLSLTVADAAEAQRWKGATGMLRLRPYVDATQGSIFDATNAAESAYQPIKIIGSTASLYGNNGSGVFVASDGSVGIGTTSPSSFGRLAVPSANVFFNGGPTNTIPTPSATVYSVMCGSNGVNGSHLTYTAASNTGGLLFNSYNYNNGSNYDLVTNIIAMPETWTLNGNGSLIRFLTASTSSSSPVEAMRIDKNGNVGINCTPNGTYAKLDVNGAFRSAYSATFYTQNSSNFNVGHNGIVLGTVAKAVAPSGGSGTIQIFSNDATGQLQASIALVTSATAANRRLQIQCIEQGVSWRDVTLCETAGNVGIGTTSPGSKFDVQSASGLISRFLFPTMGNGGLAQIVIGKDSSTSYAQGALTYTYNSVAPASSYFSMGNNTTNSAQLNVLGNGDVCIGTTTSGGKLTVSTGTYNQFSVAPAYYTSARVGRRPAGDAYANIEFDYGAADLPKIEASSGGIQFYTNGTPRLTILPSSSILCLSGGNTSATGTGIAFPANQSASSDVNTLDDYEEGTWAPVIKFGGNNVGMTYTSSGTYVKIGPVVYVYGRINITAKGSSTGTASLNGLPFTINGSNQGSGVSLYNQSSLISPGSGNIIQLYGGPGSSSYDMNYYTQTGGEGNLTHAFFGASGSCYVTAVYNV